VDDLPHPFGLDQVAQPVDAGVGQLDGAVARGRSQQGGGHVGHHDLATTSEPHDPRRPVHRPTPVVVTGPLDLARMDGHAHPDPELSELAPDLKTLINDLKKLPSEATPELTEKFLQSLNSRYSVASK